MRKLLTLLVLCAVTVQLSGQSTFKVDPFGIVNARNPKSIYAMGMDEHGYLWIGGEFGIEMLSSSTYAYARRDDNFTVVTDIEFVDKYLFTLFNRMGTLHITHESGETLKIGLPDENSTRHMVVNPDTSKKEVLLSAAGILMKVSGKGEITHLDTIGWVREFGQYSAFGAMAVSRLGIFIHDFQTGLIEKRQWDAIVPDSISAIAYGSGTSYIACQRTIHKIQDDSIVQSFQVPLSFADQVVNMEVDQKGRLWLSGIKKGLYFLENDQIYNCEKQFAWDGSGSVNALFVDTKGVVWVSVKGEGLYSIREIAGRVYGMGYGLPKGIGLSEAVGDKDGGLWLGGKGVFYLPKEGELQWVDLRENSLSLKPIAELKNDGFDPLVREMIYSPELNHGLLVQISRHHHANEVRRLYKSNDFNLVIMPMEWARWSGPNQFFFTNSDVASRASIEGEDVQISNLKEPNPGAVTVSLKDRNGKIWLGSREGLLGHIEKGVFKALEADKIPDECRKRLKNHIFDMEEDALGAIWISCRFGFVRYKDQKWEVIDSAFGFPEAEAWELQADAFNRLWVSIADGLYACDISQDTFIDFSQNLPFSKEFVSFLSYSEETDELYIGLGGHIHTLNVKDISPVSPSISKVSIFKLEAIGHSIHTYPKRVQLPSEARNLRFHYDVPQYENQDQVSFEYSYTSIDGPWYLTRDGRIEQMTASYGDHEFHVRALLGEDVVGEVSSVYYTIATPFFLRLWVQLSIAVLVLLLVFLLAWQRIQVARKRQNKERDIQMQVKVLEQQALGAMMNPHFVYNSLSSIQNYFTRNNNLEASEHVADLGQLIRMNMDAASDSFICLADELERLKLYLSLEQQRTPGKFKWDISVPVGLAVQNISIPSMVIQPFLENAIVHGIWPLEEREGLIELQLYKYSPKELEVRVIDNGVGLTKSTQMRSSNRISRGVQITRDRLALMDYTEDEIISLQERTDEKGVVLGTEVLLRLPMEVKKY